MEVYWKIFGIHKIKNRRDSLTYTPLKWPLNTGSLMICWCENCCIYGLLWIRLWRFLGESSKVWKVLLGKSWFLGPHFLETPICSIYVYIYILYFNILYIITTILHIYIYYVGTVVAICFWCCGSAHGVMVGLGDSKSRLAIGWHWQAWLRTRYDARDE